MRRRIERTGIARRILRFVLAAMLLVGLGLPSARAEDPPVATAPAFPPAPDVPHTPEKLELPRAPSTFTTTDRGWIHFSYPPGTRDRLREVLRDAEAVREELSNRLGQRVLTDVHVRVARTPGEMTTLAPEGAPYPKYASGVAYPDIGLVLLTLLPENAAALHDVDEIFRHELAHIALEDAIGGRHGVPLWFNEGLAVHLSRESPLLRMKVLSTATLAGRLIPLARLDQSFPRDASAAELAYAEAADVVRYLLRKEDSERFPQLIERLREGQTFASALKDAYGIELSSLEFEWREDVARRYSFWPVFFSGSLIWVGVLVLFVVGYHKRRRRSKETLAQWAKEEAAMELKRARAAIPETRVHIVLPIRDGDPSDLPRIDAPKKDIEVPRVEHEGQWHTLH